MIFLSNDFFLLFSEASQETISLFRGDIHDEKIKRSKKYSARAVLIE